MSDLKLESVYRELWTMVKGGGERAVDVHYCTSLAPGCGLFDHRGTNGPTIKVGRETIEDGEDHAPHFRFARRTEVELFVLAHEYGHALSFFGGERPSNYDELQERYNDAIKLGESADDEAFQAVRREEEEAWRTAERTLADLGWTNWPPFNLFRKKCLSTYTNAPRTWLQWAVCENSVGGRVHARFETRAEAADVAQRLASANDARGRTFLVTFVADERRGVHFAAEDTSLYLVDALGKRTRVDVDTLLPLTDED